MFWFFFVNIDAVVGVCVLVKVVKIVTDSYHKKQKIIENEKLKPFFCVVSVLHFPFKVSFDEDNIFFIIISTDLGIKSRFYGDNVKRLLLH